MSKSKSSLAKRMQDAQFEKVEDEAPQASWDSKPAEPGSEAGVKDNPLYEPKPKKKKNG